MRLDEDLAEIASPLARADTRVKLLGAAAFTLALALARDHVVFAAALPLALAMAALARLPLAAVAKRLAVVNVFIVFMWLFLPLGFPGEALFRLGPLTVSHQGVAAAWLITLKANTIVVALMALVATSTVARLGAGLACLGLPDRAVMLLLFTYRYLHVSGREWERLYRAALVRGYRPGANKRTYRTVAHMVGQLLVRCLERAERAHRAMLCRGFAGRFHSLAVCRLRPADYVLGLALALATGLCLYLEWT